MDGSSIKQTRELAKAEEAQVQRLVDADEAVQERLQEISSSLASTQAQKTLLQEKLSRTAQKLASQKAEIDEQQAGLLRQYERIRLQREAAKTAPIIPDSVVRKLLELRRPFLAIIVFVFCLKIMGKRPSKAYRVKEVLK